MNSLFRLSLLAALLLAVSASPAAAEYSVHAPVLGHVLDAENGSLHRVDGIPGASGIGEALPLEYLVAHATVASNQEFAIVRDDQGRFLVVNLAVSPPTSVELSGVLAGAEGAVISPSSLRAALYSAATGKVQWLEDLAGTPTAGDTMELEEGVGEWTAFAISDNGVILAAAALPEGGALYALRPSAGSSRVGGVQRVVDLAFFTGSDDAVAADASASEVLMIQDVVARRQTSVIASEQDEITNPFGVEVTADGRYVAVAVAGGVASVPVFGGRPVFTACACSPTSLLPLAGGNIFQLTTDVSAPVQIVQVGATSRVRFVPAVAKPVLDESR